MNPALRVVRWAALQGAGLVVGEYCWACGRRTIIRKGRCIGPKLAAEWGLTTEQVRKFDAREGDTCTNCHASRRCIHLARGIVEWAVGRTTTAAGSLKRLTKDAGFRELAVAEINSAGTLHRQLRRLPRLAYSEYRSTDPAVWSEDMLSLTYPSASFDLVVTSESLEHVPDVDQAMRSIRRVLKPGGAHVFTVPVLWDRPTRRRAVLQDGRVKYLLPPSYHGSEDKPNDDYLVFYEFGTDFPHACERAGFRVEVKVDPANDALTTFVTTATT